MSSSPTSSSSFSLDDPLQSMFDVLESFTRVNRAGVQVAGTDLFFAGVKTLWPDATETIQRMVVAIEPTATPLTRTFGARSAAMSRVSCASAAFAVWWARLPRVSRCQPTDVMLTTDAPGLPASRYETQALPLVRAALTTRRALEA